MKKIQHTNDLLAIFDEAAERLTGQFVDFQDIETNAQVFDAAIEVFGTTIQVFERAAKDFRKAAHDWGTASQSIKMSTQKFKRDANNFQRAIPKFRETFIQLLKDPTRSDIGTSPQVNTESENSLIGVDEQDDPATNGDHSRISKNVLIDKNGMESVKEATSDNSSSVKQANHQKEKEKVEQNGDGTIPKTSQLQLGSKNDLAQVQLSTKLKRHRTETKPKKDSEPKPKVRRRNTRSTRMAVLAHLDSPEILEIVDTKENTKGRNEQKENLTDEKKNKTVKTDAQAKGKSKEDNKKSKRSSESSKTVDQESQNVSNTDEHAKNTVVSINSTENSSIQSTPKNTDPERNAKNTAYQKLCLFCDTESNQLVSHYVNQHPEHEVPISRPSPELAELLRSQEASFTIGAVVIEGICYFCDEAKTMTKSDWEEHYLQSTGESNFACSNCDAKPKRKNDHDQNCLGTVSRIFKINSKDASLMGFMCKDCNYLKIHLSAIKKHLKDEHGYESSEERQHYEKVLLVPDLSPLPMGDMNKYEFIQAAKRFRCTICNKQTNGAKDFLAHFGELHKEIQQYDCLCGEKITFDEGNLTGKMISEHLSKHSNDLYQCVACANIYEHKKDVRNHMIDEHPDDEIKYKHLCRSNGQSLFVAETTVKKFECKYCRKILAGTFAELFDHFEAKHQLNEVDVTLFVSKKCSYLGHKSNGIDTKYTGCISSQVQFER